MLKEAQGASEIVSLIRINTSSEKRKELFLTISSLLDSIRDEEGCRGYRFYGEAGEQDSFLLVGLWSTGSDCNRHLHSERFAILWGSLELLCERKDLDFRLLSEVDGIESFTAAGAKNKEA